MERATRRRRPRAARSPATSRRPPRREVAAQLQRFTVKRGLAGLEKGARRRGLGELSYG